MGGWPDDFGASEVAPTGKGARLEQALATMRRVWGGGLEGQGGPTRALPEGRPALLFGALVPAAYTRAATQGQGWVAPLFGLPVLEGGAKEVRKAWADAGRAGQPRIVTGRYFSLGPGADLVADEYIRHYYGDEYFTPARDDTATSPAQMALVLERLTTAGVTDLVFYPCSAELDQVQLLAEAVRGRRGL